MAFPSIRNMLAGLTIAAAAVVAQAAPSSAQVYYGGYNLGPDYGAMIAQQQELMRRQRIEMQQGEQQIIAQVMQHPHFGPMYQQHRAQGGQMSPQQFAYTLAATRWGSREGIDYFNRSERRNQEAEHAAALRLREAEAGRAAAQNGYMNGYSRNHAEAGRGLQGNSTYIAPNGTSYVLPHTQPGVIRQDRNGNAFVMNNQGQYYMYTPNGWQPMRSAF